MKIRCFFHLLINFLVASIAYGQNSEKGFASIIGTSFPSDFLFGSSSSAYQYEGGAAEGGRQPSIWDTFAKQHPDKVLDHSNGNIATDSYHRYKEDVAIMKDIGFSAYRFSISWSRVLPSGKLRGGVNQEGIDYYNNLINEVLLQGIKPFVTLFHFDLPQALEDEYSGFLNISIVDDFRDYAELCFSKFGDRVKNWITLNEPLQFSSLGYSSPMFAPTRCSNRLVCSQGDSGTEPYIVGHNQLLAHAAAVKVYREKFQKLQNGQIGIALNSAWFLPYSESIKDRDAASRALAFQYDWFMEPLKSGSYPVEMVTHVGTRLPQFTPEQSSIVKGSFDFIGLNYYTSQYAMDVPCNTENFTYQSDFCANLTSERNGTPIGFKVSVWLYVYAPGLYELLLYSKNKFNDPVIYITENGVSEQDTGTVSLKDNIRVDYIDSHLSSVQKAMMNGVKVKGYLAWSLLDNWEWVAGFTARFGMVYVDFKNGLKRLPKLSAMKFKEFLQTRNQTQTGNTTKSQPGNDNVKVDL